MDRGSFEVLDHDPSLTTIKLIEDWVDKWRPFGLTEKWIKFIFSTADVHRGTNYPLIKTQKPNNPASSCWSPTENLSLFVEQYCKVVGSIKCRIRKPHICWKS